MESETWLSGLLMEFGMFLQVISLLLLVQAADSYSEVLVGAMCATGALLASPFGVPVLMLKLFGLFFYGNWIVLHRLDLCSEYSPLIRLKYGYLLLLLPLLLLDIYCLLMYLAELQPDIITSCCGVIFEGGENDGKNLVGPLPVGLLMGSFYTLAGLLFACGVLQLKNGDNDGLCRGKLLRLLCSVLWLLFFILALLVITGVISSYIYGMPFHRCPFDILKREYNYIGYPIYLTLITATFCGMSGGGAQLLAGLPGLEAPVSRYTTKAASLSLLMLAVFLLLITWYPALYILAGGER
ncbi:MAG: hypothetical protein ACWGOX_05460 [Desulforhopalus sp.]